MTFPAELAALPQFVLWRYETRGGRRTKVPYALDGRRASTTDPATWSTLEAVVLALAANPRYDGIGFVFSPTDGFAGIDLDHVIDPATGEIDARAESLIRELDSYTEYSPSGTGAHIFVRATLPADSPHKRGGIELYDRARFFTVTGRQYPGTPNGISDRDGGELTKLLFPDVLPERRITLTPIRLPAKEPLSDDELLDLAMRARDGGKFTDLWQGGWAGHGSASEADSALCWLLAFWTDRDAARVDSLFRQSGLMRPKWDERRGAMTYGERTVLRACERDGDTFRRESA